MERREMNVAREKVDGLVVFLAEADEIVKIRDEKGGGDDSDDNTDGNEGGYIVRCHSDRRMAGREGDWCRPLACLWQEGSLVGEVRMK